MAVKFTAVSLLLLSSACSHRVAKPKYEVIIPHECIISDVVCTEHPGKKMSCRFEKFKDCMVVRVAKEKTQ